MTNLITFTQNNEMTMSSREIAELVESRHDKVKQSIERLVDKGIIVQPPMGDVQFQDSLGRPRSEKVYLLIKRDTYIVVAQLCPEFTARLVDRWQELENQQKPTALLPDFSNPAEAARAWAVEYEQKQIAIAQVKEMQPTVEAYERIAVATDGAICITDAAKILQMKPKELFNWLFVHKWIYRRPGNAGWLAYQDKLQQLLLEHKIHIARREDGTEKVCEQVLITPKGLSKLAKSLNIELA
ncbi:phage antirepressor KilAC domain-containing protein [Rodentibacter pneumotropicus]|uniref:DNA-binding protein n=1 Tax=Rodentibacter pneumotropicus TaxID=758 RepID=A0A4S2QKI2_9PAST|nr:phage antirepressor KilAC domain-containing protein [Rodentibacter pneumotropicus]THA16817.1 DNA-binding protein [Rodentibacter pneumotropicus]